MLKGLISGGDENTLKFLNVSEGGQKTPQRQIGSHDFHHKTFLFFVNDNMKLYLIKFSNKLS